MRTETMHDLLDAEARYRDWSERIERISAETTTLFWSRKLVRAIGRMFETNEELRNSGGHVWNLILRLYGRDAVMAVRRELDGQARVVNLFHLLHDMEAHAPILNAHSVSHSDGRLIHSSDRDRSSV